MPALDVRTTYQGSSPTFSLGELHRDLQSAVEAIGKNELGIAFAFVQHDGEEPAGVGTRGVLALLRRAKYEHKATAFVIQQRFLLLLPCADEEEAEAFCESLLAGAREKSLGGPSFTLSIGLASLERGYAASASSSLFSQAASRARAAAADGGDQIVAVDPEPVQPAVEEEEPAPPPVDEEARAQLARYRAELEEVREKLARAERFGEREELLERRLAKLKHTLGETEAELKRVASLKVEDGGQASIYREVQGLAQDDDRYEERMGMLTAIFEANVDLQRELEARRRRESA